MANGKKQKKDIVIPIRATREMRDMINKLALRVDLPVSIVIRKLIETGHKHGITL